MKKQIFSTLLIGISILIGGMIGYFYHPTMIHLLSTEEFADFGSLVGVFNFITLLGGGLTYFFSKEISKIRGDIDKEYTFFRYFLAHNIKYLCIIYGILAVCSYFIADFLHIQNHLIVMYTFSGFVTSFIFAILDGVYRGLEKLYFIAFFNIFQHILKFLIGIPMILFGFTIFGAVSGFVLGGVIMSILSFSILWQYLKVGKYDISFAEELKTDFQSYKKDIIQNFILVILLSLLMNSDILLAKHFFSISDASIYITLSIIAKFLIFLGGAIEVVFYPIITKKSLKSLSKIDLGVPVILMSLMLIGAIGFFALIGPWFLDILKPGYGQYNTLFLQILFYCGVFMILSFYAKILIGFKKYILNMLLSLGIISLFFILFIGPVDMGDFIFSYIGVTSVLLTLTGGLLFYSLQKEEIKRYALIIASFVKKLGTSGE